MKQISKAALSIMLSMILLLTVVLSGTFSALAAQENSKQSGLKNGIYSITGKLLKTNSDEISMADAALEGTSVVVENGNITLKLDMGSIGGVYLQKFEHDNTEIYKEATASGIDGDGNITEFSFPITNGLDVVNVRFTFDMGMVMTQGARLILDWSTLLLTEGSEEETQLETVTETESETETEVVTETETEAAVDGIYELAKGTYNITAQFWHATKESLSSANDTIKSTQLVVDRSGNIVVNMSLQSAKGLDFYDFKYAGEDGIYQAAHVKGGESQAPNLISFTLPKNVEFTNMKATYPNPVMGAHIVDMRLFLDLVNAELVENSTGGGDEDGEDGSNSEIKDGMYTINTTILNAVTDDLSMGNQALESAYIIVKNNNLKLYLNMKSISGVYLDKFEYQNSNLGTEYLVAGEALKNSEGNIIRFSLPIIYETSILDVRFTFDMGSVMVQPARLALDWNTFKLSQNTTPPTETEDETIETEEIAETKNIAETEKTPDTTTDKDKTGDKILDKNKLADGIYEVEVDLWHATNNQASMASGALVKKARIVVKDGNYSMYIYTKQMTVGNIEAYLQLMQVENTGGGYTQASVSATDGSGNPTSFVFGMPHTNEYIKIKVNPELAIMGNDYVDARLKLSWGTLKQITSDTVLSVTPDDSAVKRSVSTGDSSQIIFFLCITIMSAILIGYSVRKNMLRKVVDTHGKISG